MAEVLGKTKAGHLEIASKNFGIYRVTTFARLRKFRNVVADTSRHLIGRSGLLLLLQRAYIDQMLGWSEAMGSKTPASSLSAPAMSLLIG
jgi:hypothetical protein